MAAGHTSASRSGGGLTFSGFGGERIDHVRVTDLAGAVRITLLTYVYTGPDPSTCAGEAGCLDIPQSATRPA